MTTPNAVAQSSARTTKFGKKLTRHRQLHRMITRKSGVTIAQLQKTFGWQPHTARAAISAQRKAGCVVDRLETDKGWVCLTVLRNVQLRRGTIFPNRTFKAIKAAA